MTMTIEKVCIVLAMLLFLSAYSLTISKRFNIPTLIMYIGVGVLAGSEGIGGIYFDNAYLAQFIGNFALCMILFSGAYNTDLKEVSVVKKEGLALSFAGVFVNTLLVATPIYFFTPFYFIEALLFGAIVSSTDSSAVMSILSFGGLNIKPRSKAILKLESGTNDPVANVLIVLLIGVIKAGKLDVPQALSFLTLQILVGGVMGVGFGKLAIRILDRFEIRMQELHQILILGFILATYGATNLLRGNGFMAIYILGIILGNSRLTYRRNMSRFFGSISWLVEIGMFVMLGLLVFPSNLIKVWHWGIGVAFILIFVARPLTVFIILWRAKLSTRGKLFIAWGGLKGAVPIIFATYPLVQKIPEANLIFNMVFFVVIVSVLFQGMTLPLMSKYLDMQDNSKKLLEGGNLEELEYFEENLVKLRVQPDEAIAGKRVMDLSLPEDLLLILISRKGQNILPRGHTQIEGDDELYIMAKDSTQVEKFIMDERALTAQVTATEQKKIPQG